MPPKSKAAAAAARASAAPGIVTFVLASANTSWSSWETSSNSVSNGVFAKFSVCVSSLDLLHAVLFHAEFFLALQIQKHNYALHAHTLLFF